MHINDMFFNPARQADRTRFLKNYKTGNPDSCWLWLGRINKKGYGVFSSYAGNRQDFTASRLSYVLNKGPIPDTLHGKPSCVLHHCDNRQCVNPNHLFLGTNRDNVDDMLAKGRSRKGERHGRATLTDAQALVVIKSTESHRAAARRLGVETQTIYAIRRGLSWKCFAHIPRPEYATSKGRLTPEQVRFIRADTRPRQKIAEEYGIQPRQVSQIRNRKTWKDLP